MQITDILTYGVNLGGGNHVFVKVLTDEHLYGVGEAYRVGPDDAVEQIVHYFREWLIGHDPTRIEHLWRLMYNGSRFPGGSMLNAAISGIETALWDLKGKIHGVPVYQLLGGRCRDRIRLYLGVGGNTPAELAASAKEAVTRHGMTAVKFQPMPPEPEKLRWGQVLRGTRERMEAVRRAVGDDIDLGLDPHATIFEPVRAMELAEVVKPYRPMFLEEPLRPENRRPFGWLRGKVGIPIATGEMLYTKYEFQELLDAEGADILQPDLLLCGGLLEGKKIAALAEARYLTVAPHNPLGPMSTAVATHFAASTGNFLILEYRLDSEGPNRELVRQPIAMREGHVEIPETPGLGIELNEDAFKGRGLQSWRRRLVMEADGNIGYQ